MSKIRIAHLAGPTATIQNTPPLVTSNKARLRRGLPARHTLFLTPAIWGFRDEALMDAALALLEQNPAALTRALPSTPGEWVFSSAAASSRPGAWMTW